MKIDYGVELIIIPDKNMVFVWLEQPGYRISRDLFRGDNINRDRSMIIGMIPPKLAQMMINFKHLGIMSYGIHFAVFERLLLSIS